MDTSPSSGLIMQWTEVPDARGGTRLVARWVVLDAAAPAVVPTPAPVAAHAA